ncbi:hypothetical protein AB0P21_39335 [Kribbella sp. NPDC056861]|uniref:hypothetical protein n=1 Tax=Kribbella sp. NPDC056861 TaxID=3154857 RepID=UPI0034163E77
MLSRSHADATHGGIFIAGSLAWRMLIDSFRLERWDITDAVVCLVGVALIMWESRRAPCASWTTAGGCRTRPRRWMASSGGWGPRPIQGRCGCAVPVRRFGSRWGPAGSGLDTPGWRRSVILPLSPARTR